MAQPEGVFLSWQNSKEHCHEENKFTQEQIAYALRQVESGTPIVEIVRKLGGSEQTYYRW
jgi:hypothetical protein